MFNFITKYFAAKSVAGILSTFTTTIDKLEAHAAVKEQEVVAHVDAQDKSQKLAQAAAKELADARIAVAKITAIFK